MIYKPTKENEDLIDIKLEWLNDITDLFFTNTKPIGYFSK